MFPVLATIDEGWTAATGFIRAYPRQSLGFLLVYLAAAGIGMSGTIEIPLPPWLAGLALTWGLGVAGLLILAPVWTALYRFAVLGDRSRRYLQFDVRTRRVAGIMLIMAIVTLVGATPFALGLDIMPLVSRRRLLVVMVVGFAFMAKFGGFWLNARLAIAPAMGATGTRPETLDTSWAYTSRASFRIMAMLFLVYLPMLSVAVFFFIALAVLQFKPGSTGAMVLTATNVIVTTILAAATDLTWGAVSARLAPTLVKIHRQRAADLAGEQISVRDQTKS